MLARAPQILFRAFGNPLCGALTRILYDLQIRGRERIPRTGPAIVIANHSGFLDPLFVQIATVRTIQFMLTSNFYDLPRTRWIWRLVEAIRVPEEGGARPALREAIAVLRDGGLVGVFPEGQLSADGELGESMPGAAFMAARTGAPVIPAWIEGSFKAFRRGSPPRLAEVRVRFGAPLHFAKGEGRNAGRIRRALLELGPDQSQSGSES